MPHPLFAFASSIALGIGALTFVTLAACSGGASRPPRSVARDLLVSCQELAIPPDSSVQPPVEIVRIQPHPPRSARSSGFACIQATVTTEGLLSAFKVLRTDNSPFAHACLEALREWRYKPAVHAGSPVPFDLVVTLTFSRP
jgi:TonB family protein